MNLRASVESLEPRSLHSVTLTSDAALVIGTPRRDNIEVHLEPTPSGGVGLAVINGKRFRLELPSGFLPQTAVILGKGGGDRISFDINLGGMPITIYGGGGNDRIHVDGEAIRVFGGPGDDRITVNADLTPLATLSGDAGNDYIVGGIDADLLIGGTGNDTLRGESGNDRLVGGAGKDLLDGGAGKNVLVQGNSKSSRNDTLFGPRDDTLHDGTGKDVPNSGSGKNVSEERR